MAAQTAVVVFVLVFIRCDWHGGFTNHIIVSRKNRSISSAENRRWRKAREGHSRPRSLTPNNLPPRHQHFLSRDAEIKSLFHWLALSSGSSFPICILGTGGLGKTALALELAYRCLNLQGLPPGIPALELQFHALVWTSAQQMERREKDAQAGDSVQSDAASIALQVIKVMTPGTKTALSSEDQQREMAFELMKQHRILLIIDRMEVMDGKGVWDFVEKVPPPSRVIVTTREALHNCMLLRLEPIPPAKAEELLRFAKAQLRRV